MLHLLRHTRSQLFAFSTMYKIPYYIQFKVACYIHYDTLDHKILYSLSDAQDVLLHSVQCFLLQSLIHKITIFNILSEHKISSYIQFKVLVTFTKMHKVKIFYILSDAQYFLLHSVQGHLIYSLWYIRSQYFIFWAMHKISCCIQFKVPWYIHWDK